MHIILVPDRLATARTVTLTPRLILAGVLAFLAVSLLIGFLLSWLGMRFNVPLASELVTTVQHASDRKLHCRRGKPRLDAAEQRRCEQRA